MATSSNSTIATGDSASLYAQVDQYPWDTDEEFQSGLTAILGTNSSPEQAAELTLRARCFYYSRKFNTEVDFNAYKSYIDQKTPISPNSGTSSSIVASLSATAATRPASSADPPKQQEAPYPTSFAHIVELIQSGKPIPGIKEIHPTILEGQGTAASKAIRRKPWEKDDTPVQPSPGLT